MQERYEVVMSGKAKDDLKYIITYINATLNEPTIAKKYVKIIRERIKSLEYFPQKYVIIDDEKLMDLSESIHDINEICEALENNTKVK